MNRRRFILSTAGAGLAVTGLAVPVGLAAATATEDELSAVNFGLAAELLLKDFYARTAAGKVITGDGAREIARGGLAAAEHAAALAKVLTDAGQAPAVAEDFEFAWPNGTFASRKAAVAAGLTITQAVLGAYLDATASITIQSYRTLFGSLAASLAQQVAALTQLSGGRVVGVSFPAAITIESASDAIEAYLG